MDRHDQLDGGCGASAEVRDDDRAHEGRRMLRVLDGRVRPRTESMRRYSKRALDTGRAEYPDEIEGHEYPQERGDCLPGGINEMRPCPYAMCRHHLALEVDELNGNIKHNFPDVEIGEMTETCALDLADRGGMTLEEVAAAMNLTRERIRQLEQIAFRALRGSREPAEILAMLRGRGDGDVDGSDDGSGARSTSDAIDGLEDVVRGIGGGDE